MRVGRASADPKEPAPLSPDPPGNQPMGGQASTGFHLLWTGSAKDRWRAADAAAEMFSVGGQSGELLTDVGAVATLTVVGGIWLGASVRDVVCATVVATTLVVWNSLFVRGRRAPSSAHQPLVSDEPTRHVGGDSRALGAAQEQLIERLVELGTHPVILDLLTAAVREGRWYDSVEGLEAYVGADSFEQSSRRFRRSAWMSTKLSHSFGGCREDSGTEASPWCVVLTRVAPRSPYFD